MKEYIKGGLKVLSNYVIALIFFVVFLYAFIVIAGENFVNWLHYYSFIMFLLLFAIIYSDFTRLARKEKRPQYNIKTYPLKGLIHGIIGFLPIILIEIIYPFIKFDDEVLIKIKELVLDVILGPVFFVLRIGNKSIISYIAASLVVPVIAMLSYIAGYYGFKLRDYINPKAAETQQRTTFKKSPWNPTLSEPAQKGKKKKKSKNNG
jgi:predicted Na+-dependent transporter